MPELGIAESWSAVRLDHPPRSAFPPPMSSRSTAGAERVEHHAAIFTMTSTMFCYYTEVDLFGIEVSEVIMAGDQSWLICKTHDKHAVTHPYLAPHVQYLQCVHTIQSIQASQ